MTIEVAALALAAALLHAVWNALVKGGNDQAAALSAISLGGAIAGLPIIILLPLPAPESLPFLATSVFLHLGYMVFLARAYEVGDLSQVYPIARGLSPLLIGLGGYLLVGETLSPLALIGVVISSAALFALGWLGGGANADHNRRALFFAVGTGVWISLYTISDGLGARASGNPIAFVGWLSVLDVSFFVLMMLRHRQRMTNYFATRPIGPLLGGAVSIVAYGMVIYAMSLAPMAAVSALRETSVIFATLIGTYFLKESYGRARVPAAIAVALGAALITLS